MKNSPEYTVDYTLEPVSGWSNEEEYIEAKHYVAVGLLADAEKYLSKELHEFLTTAVISGELDPHELPRDFFPRLLTLRRRIDTQPNEGPTAHRNDLIWNYYLLNQNKILNSSKQKGALLKELREVFGMEPSALNDVLRIKKLKHPDWKNWRPPNWKAQG